MAQNQEELEQRIAAYIDGQLSPAEAAHLEVFLANTDPALADRIVGMLADKVQVRALPRPNAPADLSARIMEQIERGSLLRDDEPTHQPKWWQSRVAIAASVALVLGSLGYFVATSVIRPNHDNPWTNGGNPSNPSQPLASGTPTAAEGEVRSKAGLDQIVKDENGAAGTKAAKADGENRLVAAAPASTPPTPAAPATAPAIAVAPALPVPMKSINTDVASTTPGTALADAAHQTPMLPTTIASAQGPGTPNDTLLNPAPGPVATPARGGAGLGGGGGAGGFGGAGGAGGAGGGFGAGGRGAGRGGRGGGGAATPNTGAPGGIAVTGGLATPSAAATPNITRNANPTESLAANTDNARRAVEMVTRDLSGPIVITFYAKDDQDFAKLALALNAYANTNAQANAQFANRALNQTQVLTNADPQNDPRNGVKQQQVTNFAQNAPPAPANNNDYSTGILTGNITLSTNGVVTFNSTPRYVAGQNGNALNVYNDTNPAPSGPPNLGNNTVLQNVQAAAVKGGPFRIALRADQIDELARNYRMVVLARGSTAYSFGILGDRGPQTADAAKRDELLKKANLDADFLRAAQVQAAGTNGQATANPAAGNQAQEKNTVGNTAVGAGTLTLSNGQMYLNASPALIDCVITMEPAPATASSPALQQQNGN